MRMHVLDPMLFAIQDVVSDRSEVNTACGYLSVYVCFWFDLTLREVVAIGLPSFPVVAYQTVYASGAMYDTQRLSTLDFRALLHIPG